MTNAIESNSACPVCLEIESDEAGHFQTLPCHPEHRLHEACWQDIITHASPSNPRCPLCRREVNVRPEEERIPAAVTAINGQHTNQEQLRERLLAAVGQNGLALEFASLAIQNDREVVITAVEQNGYALQFASAALKNDREVVLAAVGQDGTALRFASAALQNDPIIILAARQ